MIENASSSSGEAFSYFENTGTPSDPDLSSSPLPDPFQLTRSKDMLYGGPFVDIDDDGDQDLFVGSYYDSLTVTFYSLTFYENTMYTSIPSEKKESTNIQLYPQPAKERLRISIPDQGLKGPFSVMDMEGKLVMKGRSSEDRNPRRLDVSDLEPGLYLLRARTEEGILSRKFVVE